MLPYPTLLSALHYNVGFIGMRMGPHYLRTVRKHTMAERSAKIASYPVLKVFRRYAAFGLPLVLLSLLVNLLAFRNSGFSLLRKGLYVWA